MIGTILYNRKRLNKDNIDEYLLKKYPEYNKVVSKKRFTLPLNNLLQKHYGEAMDCSLTSITECVMYLYKTLIGDKELDDNEVYDIVEKTAEDFFYNGKKWGTIPIFIENVYMAVLEWYGIPHETTQKYFKNVGFSLNKIKGYLEAKTPVIFSMFKDGRDYYNSHTITVVGYEIFNLTNFEEGISKELIMLLVQDHWTKDLSYLDYAEVSCISEITC